jgi:hypothetical protein
MICSPLSLVITSPQGLPETLSDIATCTPADCLSMALLNLASGGTQTNEPGYTFVILPEIYCRSRFHRYCQRQYYLLVGHDPSFPGAAFSIVSDFVANYNSVTVVFIRRTSWTWIPINSGPERMRPNSWAFPKLRFAIICLGCQDHPHRQRCLTALDILAAAKFFGVAIDRDKLMES